MTAVEPDWWSILRELDEPVAPPEPIPLELILRPVEGAPGTVRFVGIPELMRSGPGERLAGPAGVETPRDFDLAPTQGRFERLTERLTEAFGCQCDAGHAQDSACFGTIGIPAEATRSRTKRTRIRLPLYVGVSSFGGLATYGPSAPSGQKPYVHPGDRQRIDEVLTALGYLIVPQHILAAPYDGPNAWVFGPAGNATWFTRFFDYL